MLCVEASLERLIIRSTRALNLYFMSGRNLTLKGLTRKLVKGHREGIQVTEKSR